MYIKLVRCGMSVLSFLGGWGQKLGLCGSTGSSRCLLLLLLLLWWSLHMHVTVCHITYLLVLPLPLLVPCFGQVDTA